MRIDEPAPGQVPAPRRSPSAVVIPAQARPVQGQAAGIVTRLLADTADFAVVAGALGLGYVGVVVVRFLWRSWAFTLPTPSFLLMLVLGGLIAVVYFTVGWSTTGRTYGDHLLGLRVVGPSGRRLGVWGALLRALFCVVFPIGIFWVAVSRHNRSVQDHVLRTSVIYDWLGGA